jgi:hypothetical protein
MRRAALRVCVQTEEAQLARCLSAWLEVADRWRSQKGRLKRAMQRGLNKLYSQAFRRWQEAAKALCSARRKRRRIGFKLLHKQESFAFVQMLRAVQTKARTEKLLGRAVRWPLLSSAC